MHRVHVTPARSRSDVRAVKPLAVRLQETSCCNRIQLKVKPGKENNALLIKFFALNKSKGLRLHMRSQSALQQGDTRLLCHFLKLQNADMRVRVCLDRLLPRCTIYNQQQCHGAGRVGTWVRCQNMHSIGD